jgi:hypothetical protein
MAARYCLDLKSRCEICSPSWIAPLDDRLHGALQRLPTDTRRLHGKGVPSSA